MCLVLIYVLGLLHLVKSAKKKIQQDGMLEVSGVQGRVTLDMTGREGCLRRCLVRLKTERRFLSLWSNGLAF